MENDCRERDLVIMGAGGHAVSVANIALAAGYRIRCFIDPRKAGTTLLDIPITTAITDFPDSATYAYAIALGDNSSRERVCHELKRECPSLRFPRLLHPSATVSHFAEVGEGTVIMPHAVVGPNSRIGEFCILNTSSSIDHDSEMLSFSSLGPGAITGGNVRVGARSAISIGAVIKHGITVGDDSVLGASSYLNKPLASNQVAYGTPARIIRARSPIDSYLK